MEESLYLILTHPKGEICVFGCGGFISVFALFWIQIELNEVHITI